MALESGHMLRSPLGEIHYISPLVNELVERLLG